MLVSHCWADSFEDLVCSLEHHALRMGCLSKVNAHFKGPNHAKSINLRFFLQACVCVIVQCSFVLVTVVLKIPTF